MIEFLPQNEGHLVALRFHGKLEHEDFEQLAPLLDEQIDVEGGSIRLLIDLEDFEGYEDLHALWDHFLLVKDHHKAVERIAVVGDEDWERLLVEYVGRFTNAEVGYYAAKRHDAALEWLAR